MKKGLNNTRFLAKISICRTNVKNPMDKNINQINFAFIRNETGKIAIKTSKCSFAIQN